MIPLLATVVPALLILAMAYPLRPQGGARHLNPNARAARRILARCEVDREMGIIPADHWGGDLTHSTWTRLPQAEAAAYMQALGDTQSFAAIV